MKPFITCLCLMAGLFSQSVLSAASNFDSLPESTVLNVRIPNGAAAAAAMKKTKLHALLHSPDRWTRVRETIESVDEAGLEAFEEALAEFDLGVEDIGDIFTGEIGAALTLHKSDGPNKDPIFCVLLYVAPEADLNQRLFAALSQVLENNQTEDIQRNDYQIGDHEVMELNIEQGDAYFFINHSDKGFAIALTDMRGPEQAKQVLAGFLDARNGDGAPNGFAKKVLSTNGLAAAIPEGTVAMEMAYNPQVALDLIPVEELATPAMPGDEMKEALGLNCFQPGMVVVSIDGLRMRQHAFFGMTQPLKGIAKLFKTHSLAPSPAAWVPADVPSYAHFGIDLSAMYQSVSELVVNIMGPAGEAQMMQVNQAPQMMIGIDLETFLASFGHRVVFLDYTKKKPEGAGAGAMGGTFSDRIAMVWEMKDAKPMRQVMPMLQAQAGMFGGMPVNEQNAVGVRFNMSMMQPGLEGGLFVTDGQLMLAVGAGVSEQVLSSLQSPPEAADSLSASPLVKRAHKLMEPKEGFMWNVQDANKGFTAGIKMMHEDFKLIAQMDPNMALVLPLLPSAEDAEGVFGVAVGQATQDADGIFVEGVVELGADESENEE